MDKTSQPPPYGLYPPPLPHELHPPPPPHGHYPPPPSHGQYPPPPSHGQYLPPPPHGQHFYPPPPPTTIIVGQPQPSVSAVIIGSGTQFGPASQNAYCPHCQNQILTRVDTETSTNTHLCALLLCILLCWPCVCIPYCIDSCKSKNHYCPRCGAFLGTYSK